jgi:hypothetical protein
LRTVIKPCLDKSVNWLTKADMSYTIFTANQFLDNEVGPGVQPVLALYQSAGLESPAYDTVRKWRERDSMPAAWFAKTLYALEVVGGRGPMSLKKYFAEVGADQCLNQKRCISGLPPSVFD